MKALYLVIVACLWMHALVAALSANKQTADLMRSPKVVEAQRASMALAQTTFQQPIDRVVQSAPQSSDGRNSQNAVDLPAQLNDHDGPQWAHSKPPAAAEIATD
jgi:hypothetical protein